MTVALSRQGLEFLWAGALGVGLGVLYDLFRALRRTWRRMAVPGDVLFALCFFLALALTAVYTRGLRLYQCLGIALGAGAYFLTASPWIVGALRRFLAFLRGIFRKIRGRMQKIAVFFKKLTKKRFPFAGKWVTIKDVSKRGQRHSFHSARP